jgi:hypothetical protein
MRVKINSESLQTLLSRGALSAAVDPIKTSPYKGFGRIEYVGGKLSVQSEGATVASRAFVHVDDDNGEEGACVCNVEQLLKMIKFIPKKDPVTLEYRVTEDDPVGIMVAKGKKGSRTEMSCAHPQLYAMLQGPESTPSAVFDGDSLFESIDRVSFAGDINDADNLRSNICIRSEAGVVYAAAARREMLCYATVGEGNIDADIFLPLSITKELKKFFIGGEVRFVEEGNNIFMIQERGWVRFCSPQVTGFPNFTAFADVDTSGKSRLAMESFLDVLGACMHANSIEAGLVIEDRKVSMASLGSDNGIRHSGNVLCSDDSDQVSERFTFSPFMVMAFFKGKKSLDPTFTLEISSGKRSVNYMKLSSGRLRFFMKERKTMTTNPIEMIDNV